MTSEVVMFQLHARPNLLPALLSRSSHDVWPVLFCARQHNDRSDVTDNMGNPGCRWNNLGKSRRLMTPPVSGHASCKSSRTHSVLMFRSILPPSSVLREQIPNPPDACPAFSSSPQHALDMRNLPENTAQRGTQSFGPPLH